MDSISHHHQKILLTSKFLKKGLQTRIYVAYLFVDGILKTFFTKMIILYYHSAGSILMTFVYQLLRYKGKIKEAQILSRFFIVKN